MAKQSQKEKDQLLSSHWHRKFKESIVAKGEVTKNWNTYFDAYKGDYFKKKGQPEYKSNLVSNYIFSIIETIRPIMLDNDPKFQCMPRQPEGLKFAEDINKALAYEWDREKMNTKLYRELINALVTGNYIFFVPFDSVLKEIKAIAVNPFNFFPDPLAKDVQSAEYIIYADYFNAEAVKRKFPDHASQIEGGQIRHTELIQDAPTDKQVDNQVLILEVWSRDHITHIDNVDGTTSLKYPKGRVTIVAPELNLVLEDKENPYQDGKFPFVHGKDYDVPGQFWGEGEVAQLLSPQTQMNELNNAILDNAKATANMPWIVDSNAGIPKGGITNQPGLIIRKRPNSEVRRDQPPGMPNYVINAVNEYKSDMEQVSGIFDTLKGNSETGVYTAQGILALQEAGQARIRLKVKLMEETLGDLAVMWFSRMGQFWKDNRFVRISQPDGSYDFKMLMKEALKEAYDIKLMAGSTMAMNRNAMLDLMIRLAQTQMPDGQPLVDREAVVEYLPQEVKTSLLRRSEANANAFEQQLQELTQVVQQQAEQSQQFQQEMSQTVQQLVQENQKNDQQTMEVIQNIVKSIEHINGKIVAIEEKVNQKEQMEQQEKKETELYDKGYNTGYGDATSEAEGLSDEGVTQNPDGSIEGGADDLELPEELMMGLESLTDDELALLQMSDPSLAETL